MTTARRWIGTGLLTVVACLGAVLGLAEPVAAQVAYRPSADAPATSGDREAADDPTATAGRIVLRGPSPARHAVRAHAPWTTPRPDASVEAGDSAYLRAELGHRRTPSWVTRTVRGILESPRDETAPRVRFLCEGRGDLTARPGDLPFSFGIGVRPVSPLEIRGVGVVNFAALLTQEPRDPDFPPEWAPHRLGVETSYDLIAFTVQAGVAAEVPAGPGAGLEVGTAGWVAARVRF